MYVKEKVEIRMWEPRFFRLRWQPGSSIKSLNPDPNINYLSGLAWRHGNKDITCMALLGGSFSVVPHEVLSSYPEEFLSFSSPVFIPKLNLGEIHYILSPR